MSSPTPIHLVPTIKLSEREKIALAALVEIDQDFALNFKSIAGRSGLDPAHVRRTVRALARKGCALYQRGLFTEEGEVAGAGYMATDTGRFVARHLSEVGGRHG